MALLTWRGMLSMLWGWSGVCCRAGHTCTLGGHKQQSVLGNSCPPMLTMERVSKHTHLFVNTCLKWQLSLQWYERLSLALNNMLNNIPDNAIQAFLSMLYKEVCFHAMLVYSLLSPSPPTPQHTQTQAHTHKHSLWAACNFICHCCCQALCYIHSNVGSVFIS